MTDTEPQEEPVPAQEKQTALDWIKDNHQNLCDWNQIIWNYAEAARRENKSAKWCVERLRTEGLEVEESTGVF